MQRFTFQIGLPYFYEFFLEMGILDNAEITYRKDISHLQGI